MAKKAASKSPASASGTIELTRLEDATVRIPIKGLTPLIVHKWSDKAKRMMPGHPEKEAVKSAKEVRKPQEEADGATYWMDEKKKRIGFPATGFKAAIVGAARFFSQLTLVETKTLVWVEGEGLEQLVEIKGEKVLREDTVRIGSGTADLRYRHAFADWSAILSIRYTPQLISAESILALVDAGGRSGVGDWRPSAPKSLTGTYGTWRVDDDGMAKMK